MQYYSKNLLPYKEKYFCNSSIITDSELIACVKQFKSSAEIRNDVLVCVEQFGKPFILSKIKVDPGLTHVGFKFH